MELGRGFSLKGVNAGGTGRVGTKSVFAFIIVFLGSGGGRSGLGPVFKRSDQGFSLVHSNLIINLIA